MAEFQTVVNDLNIVRGNGLLEVAPYIDGTPEWFTVGAIKDLAIEEETVISSEENDNADATDRINKQEVKISFIQLEILNLDVWEIMRSTLDTITVESQITKIQSGNKTEIPYFMCRITTKNNDVPFYFMAYKCNIAKGFSFAYQKDDGDDTRLQNTIEIMTKQDPARGDLVWEIEGTFTGV